MNPREILELLAAGELSVGEAQSRLALAGASALEGFARIDAGRQARKGVPEVVYAPGKSPEQLVKICGALLEHAGRGIVSGLDGERWPPLGGAFGEHLAVATRRSKVPVAG